MRMWRHERTFGGLNEDPPGAFEGHLERFSGAAASEGLERDVAPDAGAYVAAPGYRRVGVCIGGLARIEQHRLPVGGKGNPAGPLKDHVEEAAGETACALDAVDIPVDALVEGQDVVAVHGHPLVLEVEDHDLSLILRQEQVAGASGDHELDTLSGEGLLEEAPHTPALVLETGIALVGDHRPELGLDLAPLEPDLEHGRVL